MNETKRFALTFETLAELSPEIRSAHADPTPALPKLSDVLAEFSPLPNEALFLGVANDGWPVLLNLQDPVPGPILIGGDHGSGKTRLLHTIARGIDRQHPSADVKYVVITERLDEWNSSNRFENCDGILSPTNIETVNYFSSVFEWAHNNKGEKQMVVLMIDNLETLIQLEQTHQFLRWLLLRGPARHVWPIVTLNPAQGRDLESWMDAFRTRLFGHMKNSHQNEFLTGYTTFEFENLIPASQFAMREGSDWLPFWIPNLD